MPYTGFGTGFLDYDHDGDLDLAIVNGRVSRGSMIHPGGLQTEFWNDYAEPNLLMENIGGGRFIDVSDKAGAFCSFVEVGRGYAHGDLDNDGDLDLIVTNCKGSARIFRNDAPKTGHWLQVRAVDPELQRDAYGARVTLVSTAGTFMRRIGSDGSYCSSLPAVAHFGLPADSSIERVVIRWPGGETDTFSSIVPDQSIILYKGSGGGGS